MSLLHRSEEPAIMFVTGAVPRTLGSEVVLRLQREQGSSAAASTHDDKPTFHERLAAR